MSIKLLTLPEIISKNIIEEWQKEENLLFQAWILSI